MRYVESITPDPFAFLNLNNVRLQTEDQYLDSNVIVQLFSPLIASQRIMFCQFDNSYTSLQLDANVNLIFEEVRTDHICVLKNHSNSVSLFDSFWDFSS